MTESFRRIRFDSIDFSVRVMEDSNDMLALDLFTVLTKKNRKKASQTLTRTAAKPGTESLFTLLPGGNKTHKKLISFGDAIQLLMVLPKRTVDLQTRKSVAGVLTEYFEMRPSKRATGAHTQEMTT